MGIESWEYTIRYISENIYNSNNKLLTEIRFQLQNNNTIQWNMLLVTLINIKQLL